MSSPTTSSVEVSAEQGHQPKGDILTPDVTMLILTWVTFFSLLIVLHKFAWKPILDALQKREKEIRDAIENADKAKEQLANIEIEKKKILEEAKIQAVQIIEQSRKTAKDLANDIEAKGRKHAQEMLQVAQSDIEGERQKLLKSLRQESGELALSLATKLVKENMDTDKNRRLVEDSLKQI